MVLTGGGIIEADMTPDKHPLLQHIHWLGHSSFRIGGPGSEGPVLYIDPWRLRDDEPPADIILVSTDTYDHCSPSDIAKIRTPDTIVVASPAAAKVLGPGTVVLRVWQSAPTIGGISLRAVPAYSLEKASLSKANESVGFLITFSDYSVVYFAGDTDHIPEMARINCDVALLPVDGLYTMTAEEAAQAARKIRPQVVVPMHFGSGAAGTRYDGNRFCDLVKPPIEAVLLANEGKAIPPTGPLG
jgi:L-ascorbate metabolism protein UlaG (beta-lactamase superfamily)